MPWNIYGLLAGRTTNAFPSHIGGSFQMLVAVWTEEFDVFHIEAFRIDEYPVPVEGSLMVMLQEIHTRTQ